MLQDDIQEAVWRTILRGPRPPSNKWEMRNKSDASKPHSKVVKGEPKKDPPVPKKPQVQAKAQSVQKEPKPREPLSPDQAMEAARARVVKLQGVLTILGEDDEMYPTIMEALRQAESRARERPVSERIQSTKWFVERKQKRVERAKETVAQAREALAAALVVEEQQEVLLVMGNGGWQNFKKRKKPLLPRSRWFRHTPFRRPWSCSGCKTPSLAFSGSWPS